MVRHDQWAQRVYYPPTPDALTGPLLGDPSQAQHTLQNPTAFRGADSATPPRTGLPNGHVAYAQQAQQQQEGAGRDSNGGAMLASSSTLLILTVVILQ